jgi:hypothetical protein
MDHDRAKKEVGHSREQFFDSYIHSSFLPKEHRMVRYARNAVRTFDSCTSCQAEHENISINAPGGTKPQQNIHWSAVKMVKKAEHRYQVKVSVSGRSIVATQLGSKSTAAQSLTRITEVLCRAQVTSKKNYFLERIY